MDGLLFPNVRIEIGNHTYLWDVVAAPIEDELLLGIDFLQANSAVIDLRLKQVVLQDDIIPAFMMRHPLGAVSHLSQVLLGEKIRFPPNAMIQAPVVFQSSIPGTFLVESPGDNKGLYLGTGLLTAQDSPALIFINDTDHFITLEAGHSCAFAETVDVVHGEVGVPALASLDEEVAVQEVHVINACGSGESLDIPTSEVGEAGVPAFASLDEEVTEQDQKDRKEVEDGIPEHMKILYNKIETGVSIPERKKIATVLQDYQDVFSKHEFDLGAFEGLYHEINLTNEQPFRERMRRTPICFQEEEEKNLNQMLAAG